MGVRIRYIKTGNENEFLSARTFASDTTEYRVYLYCDEVHKNYKYQIVDAASGQVLEENTGPSDAMIKIKVKKALTGLGVVFTGETRNKAEA